MDFGCFFHNKHFIFSSIYLNVFRRITEKIEWDVNSDFIEDV